MLRHYVTKNGKTMRCGYTTGSCAAGAAGAATEMLLTGRAVERLDMDTPKGIRLNLDILEPEIGGDFAPNFGLPFYDTIVPSVSLQP